MTLREFLDMDYMDLNNLAKKQNEDELRRVVKDMSKIANRRLKRLSELGLPTPAFSNRAVYGEKSDYITINPETGNFEYNEFQSTGNIRELRREAKFLRNFLSSKTSTVKGAKNYLEDMVKRVEGYSSRKEARNNLWSYEESKDFWAAYQKLLETDYNMVKNIIGSEDTQKAISSIFKQNKGLTSDQLWESSRSLLKSMRNKQYGIS